MALAVFGRRLFLEPLAELLPAVDLARFSSASTRFYSQAAALARAAIRAQHGLLILDGGTMAEMHTMDCMPETLNFDLREERWRRVLSGNPLCTTYVGSYKNKVTLAQIPPAPGDSWLMDFNLRRGAYLMTLEGWGNPAHGILDLFLDGRRIGSVDWFDDYTRERSRSIDFDVRWTGAHQLVGRCSQSNADEDRPTRHWICLSGVHLRRTAGT